MKLTHMTVAALCVAVAVVACQKDQLSGTQSSKHLKGDPEQGKDVMAEFFAKNREKNTEHFKIRADKGGVIVTEEGTEVHIQPNALRNLDGSEIQGWVTVAVLDNYTRGEMFENNMPTETVPDADQNDPGMLATAGSFDFDFKTEQGGDVDAPNGGVEVHVPAEKFGDTDPDADMKIWVAEESQDQDRDIKWVENGDTPDIVNGDYKFNIGFPWQQINLDKRLVAGPWTTLTVDLPSGFDDNNAEVFVCFSNASTPAAPRQFASMDVYDAANQWWGEHLGLVNVGDNIYIIGTGVQGGTFYAEIKPVTVSINSPGGDHEILTNMVPYSIATLTSQINLLP